VSSNDSAGGADPILFEASGGIATITLNLPTSRNPISAESTVDALVEAFGRADRDREIRVAILTGAGSVFSSGGDLATLGQPGGLGGGPPVRTPEQYARGIQRIPLMFESLSIPTIAAVNGPAIGAGCDLACMADIRIASESAIFAESFVKIGLIPGDGGAWFLPRIVGYAKACEMAFTGDRLTAQDALSCGLVSKVVADDSLMAEALSLAERIAINPPDAVRMSKQLMARARDLRLADVLQLSSAMQAIAHTTVEHREAIATLKAKRRA
jgi:enoyl-CoA hydratase/carnithine racemase